MSAIVTDTLRGKTSGKETDLNVLSRRIATAWVSFTGTGTITIQDSENVSSLTDLGVGRQQVNFTQNMDNVNYVISSGGDPDSDIAANFSTPASARIRHVIQNEKLVASFILNTGGQDSAGSATIDFRRNDIIIFGGFS